MIDDKLLNENEEQSGEELKDYNQIKSDDYKKFHELYRLLKEIETFEGIKSNGTANVGAFLKLRGNELYCEALKSDFFIERLTRTVKENAFDTEMVEMLEFDIDNMEKEELTDYFKLREAMNEVKSKAARVGVIGFAVVIIFACAGIVGGAFIGWTGISHQNYGLIAGGVIMIALSIGFVVYTKIRAFK